MTDVPQEPWAPVPLPRSRAAQRRFVRELGSDADAAADAWAWLARPDLPGPSGAAGPLEQLGAAQQALYRPAVAAGSLERLARLERRLLAERAAACSALAAASASAPSRRSALAAGVVAVVGVATGFAVIASSRPAPSSSPRRSGAPRSVGAADQDLAARPLRTTADERSRILRLLERATSASGAGGLLRDRVQSAIDQTADGPYPADGRGQTATPGLVGGIATGRSMHAVTLTPGGAVTIAMALSRSAPWRARLTGAGAAGALRVAGSADGGRLQYALLLPGAARLTRLDIDVSGAVTYSWQLLQRT